MPNACENKVIKYNTICQENGELELQNEELHFFKLSIKSAV